MSDDTRKTYRFANGFVPPTKLWRHQAVGVATLIKNKHYGLFDEPGLGKTLQALYAMSACMLQADDTDGVLFVTRAQHVGPLKLILDEHVAYLDVQYLQGSNRVLDPSCQLWVVSYEVLRRMQKDAPRIKNPLGYGSIQINSDVEQIIHLMKSQRIAIICDEVHAIKNPTARTTKVVTALGRMAVRRIGMTGTPAGERPWDVWAPSLFIDNGKTFGLSYKSFLGEYAVCRMYNGAARPVRGKNLASLHAKLKTISLRRLKDECEGLPPKMPPRYLSALLPEKQYAAVYGFERQLVKLLLGYVAQHGLDARISVGMKNAGNPAAVNISALMHTLSRAAVDPALVTATQPSWGVPAKVQVILDALEEERQEASLLVFAWHRDVAEAVTNHLAAAGITVRVAHGDISISDRNDIVADFQAGKFRVLVATTGCMREAVTLHRAQRVIFVERDYSLLNWTQAQDRVHRYGQKGTVVIDIVQANVGLDTHVDGVLRVKEHDSIAVTDGTNLDEGEVTARSLLKSIGCRHAKLMIENGYSPDSI